ncbi:hypothetical protein BHM03_00027277 [Ensete ventricosum]|nr:hypothetical protein BHM03_00027277 [Ensete ventricosum]
MATQTEELEPLSEPEIGRENEKNRNPTGIGIGIFGDATAPRTVPPGPTDAPLPFLDVGRVGLPGTSRRTINDDCNASTFGLVGDIRRFVLPRSTWRADRVGATRPPLSRRTNRILFPAAAHVTCPNRRVPCGPQRVIGPARDRKEHRDRRKRSSHAPGT